MRYTTNYDIGDRKRGEGINEDSLSVTVFEQGHRDGYRGMTRPPAERQRPVDSDADREAEPTPTDDDVTGAATEEGVDAASPSGNGDAETTDDDAAGSADSEDDTETVSADEQRNDDAATDSADDSEVDREDDTAPGSGEADNGPAPAADAGDGSDPRADAGTARAADVDVEADDGGADDTDIYVAPTDEEADSGVTAPQETGATAADELQPADDADDDLSEMPANRSAGVFVLADGAGGHDAGDVASYIATTVVAENLAPVAINAVRSHPEGFDIDIDPAVLPETLGPEDIQTGLENAIIKAHREIIRYARETDTQSYTTVVAGVYADGYLHLGWVGDSRAYLVNDAREEIVPLTKDHALVEELADQGEIDDVEAHVHPDGNQITRALGGSGHENPDRAMVDVDTRSVRLFAEDTVLATSDGLIDAQTDAPQLYREYVEAGRSEECAETVREAVVTDEEIRDVLLSADTLDDAAADYVRLANERGGKDNTSVLLFDDETLPPTPRGGVPVRAVDPDVDLSERDTVIITED